MRAGTIGFCSRLPAMPISILPPIAARRGRRISTRCRTCRPASAMRPAMRPMKMRSTHCRIGTRGRTRAGSPRGA
jgi:hypothetical protein